MDIWFDIALVAHLFALMAAGATVVVMPLIAQRMATAAPETRASLAGIAQRIGLSSRIALGVLLRFLVVAAPRGELPCEISDLSFLNA